MLLPSVAVVVVTIIFSLSLSFIHNSSSSRSNSSCLTQFFFTFCFQIHIDVMDVGYLYKDLIFLMFHSSWRFKCYMNSLAKVNKKIAHTHNLNWWIFVFVYNRHLFECAMFTFSFIYFRAFIYLLFSIHLLLVMDKIIITIKSPRAAFLQRQSSSLYVIHAGLVDNYPKRIFPKLKK